MADELNTTTTTTPATTAAPAPEGTAQPGAEGAAPTAEQQKTFQSFLERLFSGKGKEADPAQEPGGTAAPSGGTQEPGSVTYTEADLQAKLEEAKAAWAAEQQEQARLAKLSPEERAKAEADADRQKVAELEAKLLQRDLKDTALAKLEKDGYPVGLAELLNYTDQDSMEKSLGHTTEIFKAALEAAVKERLRGKTPEGLGGAAMAENNMKDQIAANIRGGLN